MLYLFYAEIRGQAFPNSSDENIYFGVERARGWRR